VTVAHVTEQSGSAASQTDPHVVMIVISSMSRLRFIDTTAVNIPRTIEPAVRIANDVLGQRHQPLLKDGDSMAQTWVRGGAQGSVA
jgi:hypothetical protein